MERRRKKKSSVKIKRQKTEGKREIERRGAERRREKNSQIKVEIKRQEKEDGREL